MRHQLILQFRGDSLADYDAIVEIEYVLIGELEGCAAVDGHDIGSGETNIFIVASDPQAAFERAKPVLERARLLSSVSGAHRPVGGGEIVVLWPAFAQEFSI